MIETARIYISISLFLITITLIFHLVAMGYPRWKIYEHRRMLNKTMFIGISHRCEKYLINILPDYTKTYSICNDNKYCFYGNENCAQLPSSNLYTTQYMCNLDNNPYNCVYSSITKGLISCTIIAACTLGISLLLIFSHILINQFKYKIHIYVSGITIPLLFLGFIFILATLIIIGTTKSYDLYQYHYNLDYRLASLNDQAEKDNLIMDITKQAIADYDIRLDWASGLEIIALILLSFTLIIQIFYLISIYRNRTG